MRQTGISQLFNAYMHGIYAECIIPYIVLSVESQGKQDDTGNFRQLKL